MAQRINDRWIVSPQDIVAEFECDHKVALNAARMSGALVIPDEPDPAMDLLREQGLAHEQERLNSIDPTWRVKRLGAGAHTLDSYEAGWLATAQAMDEEYGAIYQATLFTGDFIGIADFLILAKDDDGAIARSDDGVAIYEPVDTKSARSAKRSAVLQVGAYAEALVRLGRPMPRHVHLWLAGDQDWSGECSPFLAVARHYREQVSARLPQLGGLPSPMWAAPREACARCQFQQLCEDGRIADRDLSIVQEIRSTTRQRLIDAGITTIDALATSSEADRPARISVETFDRLRAQADLQIRGEGQAIPLIEIVDEGELLQLPPRSPMDLWFDMEGDPYAPGPNGLEYMFGFGYLEGNEFAFDTTEAHDAATERKAFEDFIDEVMRRISVDPGMHVYHYANYEQRTLQRLAQQYGTRENEIDQLLREGRLIDLYTVVRRALRISTTSLSLKYIEAIYGVTHSGEDVSTAMDSVIQYERYVALMREGRHEEATQVLNDIRSYNRLDCYSTMELDTWLRTLIPTQAAATTANLDTTSDDTQNTEDPKSGPFDDLIAELDADLPADPQDRDEEQRARALLSAALHYHPRERRPAWWRLFELIKAQMEDLELASDVLVAGATEAGEWSKTARMKKHRRDVMVSSDQVDVRLVLEGVGDAFLLYEQAPDGMARPSDSSRGYNQASIANVRMDSVSLMERAGRDGETWHEHPIAVLPGAPYNTSPIEQAIAAAANQVLPSANGGRWRFPAAAWADLLLARAPRTRSGALPNSGDAIDDVTAALLDSDDSYVAVQGPPGTGKTYVGSRVVARLAKQGWRIGVVAQSHAVVDNFLAAIHGFDPNIPLGKEPQGEQAATSPWHTKKIDTWATNQPAGYVVGGTAWTFSRNAVRDLNLDLLVIDEAGQFALANAIACASAANTVLLLGDPQQLPQVSQAAHPEAIEASVLEHIIGGHPTMPADRGYFLNHTYRMHPDLTWHVSQLQYEGRLLSAPVTALRHLDGITPGVIPIPVDHAENTTASPEEAVEIVQRIADLLGRGWIDARNDRPQPERPITQGDIIVVAAYNAQVRLLKRTLDDAGYASVQVGTVDKFQGKEAPVVIVSMATSSGEDLPRGLDFLLSPNRLNVAISRAEWASFIVFSPQLMHAQPASVEGLRRFGQFLQLVDPIYSRG